ncbi:MAG: hypothetical protein ACK57U_02930, partial [Planctomycetota bacterium]
CGRPGVRRFLSNRDATQTRRVPDTTLPGHDASLTHGAIPPAPQNNCHQRVPEPKKARSRFSGNQARAIQRERVLCGRGWLKRRIAIHRYLGAEV